MDLMNKYPRLSDLKKPAQSAFQDLYMPIWTQALAKTVPGMKPRIP